MKVMIINMILDDSVAGQTRKHGSYSKKGPRELSEFRLSVSDY